jgi:hypothetical protein
MKWVVNWFLNKEKWWKARADESDIKKKKGHSIYAWKQVGLWSQFGEKAKEEFMGIQEATI